MNPLWLIVAAWAGGLVGFFLAALLHSAWDEDDDL